jgi:hypothetical protein
LTYQRLTILTGNFHTSLPSFISLISSNGLVNIDCIWNYEKYLQPTKSLNFLHYHLNNHTFQLQTLSWVWYFNIKNKDKQNRYEPIYVLKKMKLTSNVCIKCCFKEVCRAWLFRATISLSSLISSINKSKV